MEIEVLISNYERILKEKKISKSEFYNACGFSSSAVSQWKSGNAKPSLKTLDNIANFLGVELTELLGGADVNGKESNRPLPPSDLMFALWGDDKAMTEEDLQDVMEYAELVRKRKSRKQQNG